VPIGLEEFHEGVVDIVSRRALRFEGAKGLEMLEGPVPDELNEEVEQRRAELVERVSEVSWEQTHIALSVLSCTELAPASRKMQQQAGKCNTL
jgi:elongation factor G